MDRIRRRQVEMRSSHPPVQTRRDPEGSPKSPREGLEGCIVGIEGDLRHREPGPSVPVATRRVRAAAAVASPPVARQSSPGTPGRTASGCDGPGVPTARCRHPGPANSERPPTVVRPPTLRSWLRARRECSGSDLVALDYASQISAKTQSAGRALITVEQSSIPLTVRLGHLVT